MVPWLRCHTSNTEGRGHSLVPGQGTKIPHGAQPKKEKEKI